MVLTCFDCFPTRLMLYKLFFSPNPAKIHNHGAVLLSMIELVKDLVLKPSTGVLYDPRIASSRQRNKRPGSSLLESMRAASNKNPSPDQLALAKVLIDNEISTCGLDSENAEKPVDLSIPDDTHIEMWASQISERWSDPLLEDAQAISCLGRI